MSTPPFDPDDPRLTAYALGEAGASDRQAVEKILGESTEARAEVEQTRALALALETAYSREHALYLATHPANAPISNVVEFRADRRRGWQHAAITGLKVAAVLTLAASLLYFTLRRPQHPEDHTVASAPSGNANYAPAPAPALADPPLKDKSLDETDAAIPSGSPPALDIDKTPPEVPAGPQLAQTETNSNDARAMQVGQEAGNAAAAESRARSAGSSSAPEATSVVTRAAAPAVLPSAASVNAFAKSERPGASDEPVARSIVRVRSASGDFVGGVLVSDDGLILFAATSPAGMIRPPYVVILADKRELPAVVQPSKSDLGQHWLRIAAKGLPSVALASEVPADNAPLTVAFVSRHTGVAAFSHVKASRTTSQDQEVQVQTGSSLGSDEEAAFAFNAAGQLLMIEPPVPELKVVQRAKAADRRTAPAKLLVRPFTESERGLLRQNSESKGHE